MNYYESELNRVLPAPSGAIATIIINSAKGKTKTLNLNSESIPFIIAQLNSISGVKRLLGKGMFSTAWLMPDGKVLLHSTDRVKECMGMGWFPDHSMFPTIERLEDIGDVCTYSMKYYPKVKSLKNNLEPRQWKLYQLLRKLDVFCSDDHFSSDHWREVFLNIPDEYTGEREALIEAIDDLGNYGTDAQFEISPRNVATENGKLILLDCFFMRSQANEIRASKRGRN